MSTGMAAGVPRTPCSLVGVRGESPKRDVPSFACVWARGCVEFAEGVCHGSRVLRPSVRPSVTLAPGWPPSQFVHGYNGECPTIKRSAAETERKGVLVAPIERSEPDELGCSTVGRKVGGSSSENSNVPHRPRKNLPGAWGWGSRGVQGSRGV